MIEPDGFGGLGGGGESKLLSDSNPKCSYDSGFKITANASDEAHFPKCPPIIHE